MVDRGVEFTPTEVRKLAHSMLDLKFQLKRDFADGNPKDPTTKAMHDVAERLGGCAVLLLSYVPTDADSELPPPPRELERGEAGHFATLKAWFEGPLW